MKRLLTLLLLLATPLMAANWGPYGEPLYDINGNFLMKNNTAGTNFTTNAVYVGGFVKTDDTRPLTFTNTLTAYQGYRLGTNMVYEPTEWVTADYLDMRLQAFAAEKWYGTAETNVFLPGKGAMWTTEPTTQWVSTNALAAGTNLLGVYATTNIIYGNEITAQEFLFHVHVRYTGVGGPAVSVFGTVVAISADGSTTTTVDSTSIDVLPSSITTYYEFDQRAHLSTNIVLATNSYIGVLWYGIRSGGVSANLFTAGGGGLGTSIRTGNISYSDGHVPEAPSDGSTYGRKDGAWAAVTGTGDFLADGSVPLSANGNAGGNTWTNLATPTTTDSAATKGYVDAATNYVPATALRTYTNLAATGVWTIPVSASTLLISGCITGAASATMWIGVNSDTNIANYTGYAKISTTSQNVYNNWSGAVLLDIASGYNCPFWANVSIGRPGACINAFGLRQNAAATYVDYQSRQRHNVAESSITNIVIFSEVGTAAIGSNSIVIIQEMR